MVIWLSNQVLISLDPPALVADFNAASYCKLIESKKPKTKETSIKQVPLAFGLSSDQLIIFDVIIHCLIDFVNI